MSGITENVSFDSLNELAIREFPEILPQYQKELEAWKDQIPGQHVVYADILTPYLIELVNRTGADDRIRAAFETLTICGVLLIARPLRGLRLK